jgi:wobble nucleotide-excising tRNase
MLLKIKNINNFGIFRNFTWDTTVVDKNSRPKQFKRLNLIYARNYSGKTTLSRLMQIIEFKKSNPYYQNSNFELIFENNLSISTNSIQNNTKNTKVYNKDFIEMNLGWDKDSKGNIKAFSVMGKENVEIANIIEKIKPYLEDDMNNTNTFRYYVNQSDLNLKKKEANEKVIRNRLKEECTKKAKAIKEDRSTYGVKAMYERNDIENDLNIIKNLFYVPLPNKMVNKLLLQIHDIEKSGINSVKLTLNDIKKLWNEFEEIMVSKVTPSQIIKELDQNKEISSWALNGLLLHKSNNLKNCSFCGNDISIDRLLKLDSYFDKKIIEYNNRIDNLINILSSENNKITRFMENELPNIELLYKDLQLGFVQLKEKLNVDLGKRTWFNQQLIQELTLKKNHLNTSLKVHNISLSVPLIDDVLLQIESIISTHNNRNENFKNGKELAQKKIKDNSLFNFLLYIDYYNTMKELRVCIQERDKAEENFKIISDNYSKLLNEMEILKSKRISKESGLNLVNDYLKRYFSTNHLEIIPEDDNTSFKVMRDNEEAMYLSEGECSLISFCYFMATLKDVDLKQTIIWIDDPISSLDNNNIFFIFGLIDSELCRLDGENEGKYKQLFITTHNLQFFKYLKSIKPITKGNVEFFMIERNASESKIKLMPDHIKNYATEYHYLFSKIYQIHEMDESNINEDISYNFGNNLRKFLEVHLAFKYPNNKNYVDNLRSFFPDGHTYSVINRLTNEASHLKENLEGGVHINDISEIKTVATLIISKLKENDESQFNELLSCLS